MNEPTTLHSLQLLRAQGVHLHDPVRFHYLEVLSRRLPSQPVAVQQVLADRLNADLAAFAERAKSTPVRGAAESGTPPSVCALAQLNREIGARAQSEADEVLLGDGASVSAMKSVRQFSEVWSKISAEQQVVQALNRAPENAGPLNSHKLVLRSLSLMRTLSPDYLRRFMAQMESLLWLEGAGAKPERVPVRQGRGARGSRKPAPAKSDGAVRK